MIKKICFFLVCLSCPLWASFPVDFSITTGYIWKNDHVFKETYGRGIQDKMTLDLCYWFWRCYGIGLKGSLWETEGNIASCQRPIRYQEIPIILYLRGRKGNCLQTFWSIGGGCIAVEERTCLSRTSHVVPAAEGEVGLALYLARKVFATFAFRYIYAKQVRPGTTIDADYGGYGIRGGFGVTF